MRTTTRTQKGNANTVSMNVRPYRYVRPALFEFLQLTIIDINILTGVGNDSLNPRIFVFTELAMGNSIQIEEVIDSAYYSLPKSKRKDSNNHAAAALFFSGGGSRRNKKSTTTRRKKISGQIVCCSMESIDEVIEEKMDVSILVQSHPQESSKTQSTEPSSESVTIIHQLIDALDLNFLLKSSESLENSPRDSVCILASSSSPSSSSSELNSSTLSPAHASSPVPSPPLSPREFQIIPTIRSSLNFAEMGGSMLSRDIAWNTLFQRYIIEELEEESTT